MELLQGYLRRRDKPLLKWKDIDLSVYPSVRTTKYLPKLVPLHGTKYYDELNEVEKQSLYLEFTRFNAEVIIYLENMFSHHYKKSIRQQGLSEEILKGIDYLIEEETYHTKAYQDFLKLEGWKDQNFLINNRPLIFLTNLLVKISPLSILIIGGKAEAFSVNYSKYMKEVYGSWEDNRWTKLNHLHMQDEIHHYPFQVEVYQEAKLNAGYFSELKKFICSIVFFFIMQYVFVYSHFCIAFRGLQNRSFFYKLKISLKMCHWVALIFPPMKQARAHIQSVIEKYNVKFSPIFRILYR